MRSPSPRPLVRLARLAQRAQPRWIRPAVVGLALLLATALVGACGSPTTAETAPAPDAAAGPIEIVDAWVAPVDLSQAAPGEAMSVAYGRIVNHTDSEQRLVGVQADGIETVELHETRTSGTSGTMVEVDQITVPARGEVELEPGGLHLMLMNPSTDLAAGDKLAMTFDFADQPPLTLEVTVRDRHDRPELDHSHHDHHDHGSHD